MNALAVGDLVQLKKHCKNSDRWALIIKTARYRYGLLTIAYLDTGEVSEALDSNIEVYSHTKE